MKPHQSPLNVISTSPILLLGLSLKELSTSRKAGTRKHSNVLTKRFQSIHATSKDLSLVVHFTPTVDHSLKRLWTLKQHWSSTEVTQTLRSIYAKLCWRLEEIMRKKASLKMPVKSTSNVWRSTLIIKKHWHRWNIWRRSSMPKRLLNQLNWSCLVSFNLPNLFLSRLLEFFQQP